MHDAHTRRAHAREMEGAPSSCGPAPPMTAAEVAARVVGAIILLGLAALFSGLTLGILGLDTTQLEIVKAAGSPEDRANAALILPVRKKGNLLLCTLVLGNVAVTSLEAILMADLSGGLIGFLLTTFFVVVFGEIVPQSVCARYALSIGARAVPLVEVLIFIMYPATKPLALALDAALGEEMGVSYSRAEFLKLVTMQAANNVVTPAEAAMVEGALTFRSKTARDVMTPAARMFSLRASDTLAADTMERVFRTGFSRVPVWDARGEKIVGLLLAKDLMMVTPADAHPVISVVHFFGR